MNHKGDEMPRIKAYDICVAVERDTTQSAHLQILDLVQEAINQGWQPQGGPILDVGERPDGTSYRAIMQAIVRYED
jgi:hypothetical protein